MSPVSHLLSHISRLPKDGTVHYQSQLISSDQADKYYQQLLQTVAWQHDEAVIFGKRIVTKRKVAWYGDDTYAYTYSNHTRHALPWTRALLELKQFTEAATDHRFNSCLLNLYHDGQEGMAWHSDDERALGTNTVIAALSLGAERRFLFRHKQDSTTVELQLGHGSLLVMKGTTQTHWLHALPKSARIKTPRISLTFRTIVS